MTKAFYTLALLLYLVFGTPIIEAQTPTLINREWVDTTGTTPIYSKNYVSATTDGTDFYLLQHSNYQLVKIDDNGNVLWQTQYNSAANLNDYGTSIYLGSGYLYATGFAYDSIHNTSVINTLKLDLNGDTIWTVSYQGGYSGYAAPANVIEDDSGNVYVC